MVTKSKIFVKSQLGIFFHLYDFVKLKKKKKIHYVYNSFRAVYKFM